MLSTSVITLMLNICTKREARKASEHFNILPKACTLSKASDDWLRKVSKEEESKKDQVGSELKHSISCGIRLVSTVTYSTKYSVSYKKLLMIQHTSELAEAVLTFDPKKNTDGSQSPSFSKDYLLTIHQLRAIYKALIIL